MTTDRPTYFLLDAANGWRQWPVAATGGTVKPGETGLTLASGVDAAGHHRHGYWISGPLDSRIDDCQWHRVTIELTLPEGCAIAVSTFSAPEKIDPPGGAGGEPSASLGDEAAESLWQPGFDFTRPADGVPAGEVFEDECLVFSASGRYLWLRLRLTGDGDETPVIRAIRVHFPRESYLAQLPAVFGADDQSRWFLERFLSIFQAPWDELETRIARFSRFLDPKSTPDEFLPFLAQWLGLRFGHGWTAAARRRLLEMTPASAPIRGSVAALQRFLRVCGLNLTGHDVGQQPADGLPRIVEGFHERDRWWLSLPQTMGRGSRVWGPDVPGRLRLDGGAVVGEARLPQRGDPQRDIFDRYAHRFEIYLPAGWIDTPEKEAWLRRVLDAEVPAHTHYELRPVGPQMQVGVQSILGLDTLLGTLPQARLASSEGPEAEGRTPGTDTGYDTLLGGAEAEPPCTQSTGAADG